MACIGFEGEHEWNKIRIIPAGLEFIRLAGIFFAHPKSNPPIFSIQSTWHEGKRSNRIDTFVINVYIVYILNTQLGGGGV